MVVCKHNRRDSVPRWAPEVHKILFSSHQLPDFKTSSDYFRWKFLELLAKNRRTLCQRIYYTKNDCPKFSSNTYQLSYNLILVLYRKVLQETPAPPGASSVLVGMAQG